MVDCQRKSICQVLENFCQISMFEVLIHHPPNQFPLPNEKISQRHTLKDNSLSQEMTTMINYRCIDRIQKMSRLS